jgi:aminoglycoside phosphotransferase family enzyme
MQENGALTLSGAGAVVDWLVKMRRLPSERMLDAAIQAETVTDEDIVRFCRVLTHFYKRTAAPVIMTPTAYRDRYEEDINANFEVLGKAEFDLPKHQLKQLAKAQQRFITEQGHLLEQRARQARIVEGHGDLRPEHICLLHEPVVIDCLEFNRDLRIVDPLDELSYLALECERLGAPEIGARVLKYYIEITGDRSPTQLIYFYKLTRACLRAKIALWHTDDHEVSDHDKWRLRAKDYLALAERYSSSINPVSGPPL